MIVVLTGNIKNTLTYVWRGQIPTLGKINKFFHSRNIGELKTGQKFRIVKAESIDDSRKVQGLSIDQLVELNNPHPTCLEMARAMVRPCGK